MVCCVLVTYVHTYCLVERRGVFGTLGVNMDDWRKSITQHVNLFSTLSPVVVEVVVVTRVHAAWIERVFIGRIYVLFLSTWMDGTTVCFFCDMSCELLGVSSSARD